MSHIHSGNGEYDLTVGAYIVRMFDGQPKVFLHLHKKINKLLPIGGHVELNETPRQAIFREIAEESGYTAEDLQLLQPDDRLKELSDVDVQPQPIVIASYAYDDSHNHTDLAFAYLTTKDPSGAPDLEESRSFAWLTKQELVQVEDDKVFPNTREIYLYLLDQLKAKKLVPIAL